MWRLSCSPETLAITRDEDRFGARMGRRRRRLYVPARSVKSLSEECATSHTFYTISAAGPSARTTPRSAPPSCLASWRAGATFAIGVHRQDHRTNITTARHHAARDCKDPMTALRLTGQE